MTEMTYGQRAKLCSNPTAKKLFQLIEEKKTNLAINADVTKKKDLLSFINLIGPQICVLKTHIDLIDDFDQELVKDLLELSRKHRFLIFEDRKFADIGTISKMQYQGGMYQISNWADITNAHPIPGPGIIHGLKEAGLPLGRGLLLLAEMSSEGSLANGAYTHAAVSMAKENSDFVIGFIAQRKLSEEPCFIHFTPGIKFTEGRDTFGQQYNTPENAILQNGSDVIIVGRGIIQAADPLAEAIRYREAGMQAAVAAKKILK